MEIEIDYSNVPQANVKPIDEDWDPPSHVYFGKKGENGKREKEPVYSHKEYPRLVYSKPSDKIIAKIVNSDAELLALGEGWEKTPAKFGYISAPSWEESLAIAQAVAESEIATAEASEEPRVSGGVRGRRRAA